MQIRAIVKYREAYAEYTLTQEEPGIFAGTLVSYKGSTHDLPPPIVTLTKGVRRWSGSFYDQSLIDDLGEIIELNTVIDVQTEKDGTLDEV
jgi:hypothetical protein